MDIHEMGPEWLFRVVDRMHHSMLTQEFERRKLSKASQPFILFVLEDEGKEGSLSQKELAMRLGVSQPTAAVSIRRMEAAGLLRKVVDADDQRRNCITLTPKGSALVRDCKDAFDKIDKRMFEGFSVKECSSLRSYYLRMIGNLEAMGAQGPADIKGRKRT
jgi:DNA-binding MarR family transcriptional regulator